MKADGDIGKIGEGEVTKVSRLRYRERLTCPRSRDESNLEPSWRVPTSSQGSARDREERGRPNNAC